MEKVKNVWGGCREGLHRGLEEEKRVRKSCGGGSDLGLSGTTLF